MRTLESCESFVGRIKFDQGGARCLESLGAARMKRGRVARDFFRPHDPLPGLVEALLLDEIHDQVRALVCPAIVESDVPALENSAARRGEHSRHSRLDE